MTIVDISLAIAFFLIALLYASVGSGGGSGYLATMGLVGIDPLVMKPTALALNVLVTSISTWKFVKAGHFSGCHFWPIALFSIPFAFIGGRLNLSSQLYRIVVGFVLLYAAFRMLWTTFSAEEASTRNGGAKRECNARFDRSLWQSLISTMPIVFVGSGVGFVSGILGIGGGIFLSPILILSGWLKTKDALGVTAAFVLLNSIAGLLGRISVIPTLPTSLWIWLPAVGLGGYLGASLAQGRFDNTLLRRLLAIVLFVGGLRMTIG